MKKLRGTGVAIVTPFKNDYSIDFSAMERVVNHTVNGGVNYIVVLGTTGESVTLSKDEKKAVICQIKEVINNRVPLVVGIGGNNTQEIINQVRNTDLNGVDAVLSVAPYYNKPNQRGIFQHFKAIANSCPVPLIIYNVPGRTGCNIAAETCLQLAHECENIVGVKEASGNLEQIMKIIKDKPESFLVISGNDMDILPICAIGGAGVISVFANAYPAECSEITNLALKMNFKSAREIHFKFMEMIDLCFTDGSPAGVKAMLSLKNLCNNTLRLPLVPVSKPVFFRIQKAMDELK